MEKVRHGTDMVQTPVFEGVCACVRTHAHKVRGAHHPSLTGSQVQRDTQ